mgnify:FL=1
MIGILTEKPSAKANFAKALGGNEGVYNGETYVLVNALGHLYQLKDPEKQVHQDLQKDYKSWALDNLPWDYENFKWEYETSYNGKDLLKEIKNVLSKCDEIVIATDIDPTGEGDLLAGEILLGLKLDNKKLSRMEFVDESTNSLQKAFINRRPIKDLTKEPAYQKALFRSKWDFLSMQFTRIATNLSPMRGVLRQGRLKSTMVWLTGEALNELNKYEKIPYFQNRFIDENKIVYTNAKEQKYDKKEQVPNKYKESEVVLEKTIMKKTPPPRLMDLAMLSSRLASHGYSSKEIQSTYQKMYQEGYLSYPRTADKNITYEQFNEMLPIADNIAKVVGVDVKHLKHKKPRKTHVMNKGSHGANRPGLKVPKNLNELKRFGRSAIAIYTLLAKNYLAMLCNDYEYEHQQGYIKDYPDFKGSANVPKILGWKEVYETGEDDDKSLGLGKLGKPFVYEGYPPAPPTPTMNWLMKQLEKHDVGSGATRTSTFTEVTNQSTKFPLMKSDRGKLSMTIYGELSYQLLKGTKIGDVKTTEEVLRAMDKIGEGDFELINEKLAEVEGLVKHDLKVMKENAKTIKKPEFAQVEKEVFKNDKGKEISFKKEWGGHKFTEEEIDKLIKGEVIIIKKLKNKRGKTYDAKGKLREQKYKGRTFWGFKMEEYIEEGKEPVKFDN